MESAVANLCAPGDRVAVVRHGSFGERWLAICEQHGARRAGDPLRVGRAPTPTRSGPRSRESGVASRPLPAVRHLDRRRRRRAGDQGGGRRRTLVVDAISSLGAVPLETDEWGIDVVVSGSQKALMAPPGLAMAVGPGAVLAARSRRAASTSTGAQQEGAGRARRRVHAGGVAHPQPRRRARPSARAGPRGRVRPPCPPRPRRARGREGDGSRALLARRRLGRRRDRDQIARGIDADELLRHLRDRHGVTLAPGQQHLKGKIFRIGHIGWFDIFDIATALAAVELRSPSWAQTSSEAPQFLRRLPRSRHPSR